MALEIRPGQLLFVTSHRGGVSHNIGSLVLEVSVSPTPEQAAAGKSGSFVLAIHPELAEKMIASLQTSLGRLRGAN